MNNPKIPLGEDTWNALRDAWMKQFPDFTKGGMEEAMRSQGYVKNELFRGTSPPAQEENE